MLHLNAISNGRILCVVIWHNLQRLQKIRYDSLSSKMSGIDGSPVTS